MYKKLVLPLLVSFVVLSACSASFSADSIEVGNKRYEDVEVSFGEEKPFWENQKHIDYVKNEPAMEDNLWSFDDHIVYVMNGLAEESEKPSDDFVISAAAGGEIVDHAPKQDDVQIYIWEKGSAEDFSFFIQVTTEHGTKWFGPFNGPIAQ